MRSSVSFRKWNLNETGYPATVQNSSHDHIIDIEIESGWGNQVNIINKLYLQDQSGSIIEKLINEKWYLNPYCYPERISFIISSTERPSFFLLENGMDNIGIKFMTIYYDQIRIWKGEIPQSNVESCFFQIAIPCSISNFQKPSIHNLRNSSVSFTLDIDGL